jgi:alpha-D-ribose 1-methylphosphonate 5-triphosphate diphosphatase PhnM
MEELHQAVMRNLNKSVGHEVSDDVVFGKVMEILRQNPVNLYSFVGHNPSNQKTGHKKLNKYDDVFSKKVNKTNQTLTIWLMSTVMKYLQKRTLTIFQSCTKLHLLLYYLNL